MRDAFVFAALVIFNPTENFVTHPLCKKYDGKLSCVKELFAFFALNFACEVVRVSLAKEV